VSRGSVVVSAALAQRPGAGGHTWFALQYLLGFRALGWEVTLVDRLDPGMSGDGLAYLAEEMERFGLGGEWSVLLPEGQSAGLPRAEVERRLASADFLLNVMGYLEDEELLALPPLRVFLDIDPGFGQMWRELGLADPFAGHDRFVSVGLEVGEAGCEVPDCGLEWIPTVPPVALACWPAVSGGEAFTSVATWRGPYGPVEYGGHTYGLRVHEFRRFVSLPERAAGNFELALAIDPGDAADLERLRRAGWTLLDPGATAPDPGSYRSFIQASAAEFTVAKAMYVDSRSGWFSDRSACYLASGKPVVAQETGFGRHLQTGEGLLAFSTLEEAVAAVEAVRADPRRHARAAREIAEEHFDAGRVLGRLTEELGAVRAHA
jgi:glycosyltransferase involved in cell wall biosynthesis